MGSWTELLNNDDKHRSSKKPDKKFYCRKNRQGKNYGPHVYTDDRCIYCTRLKNKNTHNYIDETQGEENE
jgi:hypothetical protein